MGERLSLGSPIASSATGGPRTSVVTSRAFSPSRPYFESRPAFSRPFSSVSKTSPSFNHSSFSRPRGTSVGTKESLRPFSQRFTHSRTFNAGSTLQLSRGPTRGPDQVKPWGRLSPPRSSPEHSRPREFSKNSSFLSRPRPLSEKIHHLKSSTIPTPARPEVLSPNRTLIAPGLQKARQEASAAKAINRKVAEPTPSLSLVVPKGLLESRQRILNAKRAQRALATKGVALEKPFRSISAKANFIRLVISAQPRSETGLAAISTKARVAAVETKRTVFPAKAEVKYAQASARTKIEPTTSSQKRVETIRVLQKNAQPRAEASITRKAEIAKPFPLRVREQRLARQLSIKLARVSVGSSEQTKAASSPSARQRRLTEVRNLAKQKVAAQSKTETRTVTQIHPETRMQVQAASRVDSKVRTQTLLEVKPQVTSLAEALVEPALATQVKEANLQQAKEVARVLTYSKTSTQEATRLVEQTLQIKGFERFRVTIARTLVERARSVRQQVSRRELRDFMKIFYAEEDPEAQAQRQRSLLKGAEKLMANAKSKGLEFIEGAELASFTPTGGKNNKGTSELVIERGDDGSAEGLKRFIAKLGKIALNQVSTAVEVGMSIHMAVRAREQRTQRGASEEQVDEVTYGARRFFILANAVQVAPAA